MEFIQGGELFKHIVDHKWIPEERARFYAAQVILALGHIHSKNIIYRDLKPENVLIDDQGYIRLTDFGLSKMLQKDEKAMSFCGTAEYLAPEMIDEQGHDKAVDFWALGVLIYEMIVGIPPFYNKDRAKMFNQIKTKSVKYPDKKQHGISVSEEAKDIINLLLEKNPKNWLGMKEGADEILSHPFFK